MSDTLIGQKLTELSIRIKDRLDDLASSEQVPEKLQAFISREELWNIYQYLLEDHNKESIWAELSSKTRYRLPKETSGLWRTLNFGFEPNTGDAVLILETKSKLAGLDELGRPPKNPHTPKFSGTFKTTKSAWRIDIFPPKKLANSVAYFETPRDQHALAKELGRANKLAPPFKHDMMMGNIITAKPSRRHYAAKMSLYSIYAERGDLNVFLKRLSEGGEPNLSEDQLNGLTLELLQIVQLIHEKGIIHQDIKDANILVFQDENNVYHLKLIDFGEAYDPDYIPPSQYPGLAKSVASAPTGYHSPEIAAAILHTSDPALRLHITEANALKEREYLLQTRLENQNLPRSHGQDFISPEMRSRQQAEKYNAPHLANDMWAVGVVLYQLFHNGILPTKDSLFTSPVIAGLLHPDRNERLTAKQAILLHKIIYTKNKSEYSESLELLVQDLENLPKHLQKYVENQMRLSCQTTPSEEEIFSETNEFLKQLALNKPPVTKRSSLEIPQIDTEKRSAARKKSLR